MSSTAWAIEQLQVTIGHWQLNSEKADGLKLENVDFDARYTEQGLTFDVTADEMRVLGPLNKLSGIRLHCVEVQYVGQQISCQKGQFTFTQKDVGRQKIDFTVEAEPERQHYRITTSGFMLASAKIAVVIALNQRQWQIYADVDTVDIAALSTFLRPYLSKQLQQTLLAWQHAGKATLKLAAKGDKEQVNQAQVDAHITQLEVSNDTGQFVTEGLETNLTFKFKRHGHRWHWQTALDLSQGQAYAEPIFLDLHETPIELKAEGVWQQKTNHFEVTKSTIKHQNVGQAEIAMTVIEQDIESLKIDIPKTALAPVYQHWLQPFTVGTATDNLTINGQTSLHYQQGKTGYELQLGLDNVSASDGLNRFAIEGATGELAWTTRDKTIPINLEWQKATLYSIPIGLSILKVQTQKAGMTLLQPWHVPILDGELKIKEFALNNHETSGTTWEFEGLLTPVSMTELSEHLGWPTLHGKLSGVIPKVAYQAQEIKIDGALMIKLFHGTTIIHDLRLTNAFGAIPQLYSNIDLIGFDLETMTETFDFGKITGTLEGKIQNLRLANWQPVAFDAYLRTQKKDKVRHRISQQAVNNLSELGGGASGALSRSALRFFEDFSYQRLGLSCKLRNEVCEMAGVEEAEQGYYMVKGGGFPPRINVIGYTRRVDWPELIDRLKTVSNSPGPVVE